MELQDFLKDVEPLHESTQKVADRIQRMDQAMRGTTSSASARGVKRARKSDKKPDPAEMADSEREAS